MDSRKRLFLIALALVGCAAQAAQGNPAAGSKKIAMCLGCHGIANYKTSFPSVYHVPKLGGQHPEYIVKALAAYKSGERSHPSMKGQVETLSQQDMLDIAAYLGGIK